LLVCCGAWKTERFCIPYHLNPRVLADFRPASNNTPFVAPAVTSSVRSNQLVYKHKPQQVPRASYFFLIDELNWRPSTSSINRIFSELTGAGELSRVMLPECIAATDVLGVCPVNEYQGFAVLRI